MEIGILGIWGCGGCLSVAALIFWVIALVDCLRRDFPGENEKLVWILVMCLTWFVGSGWIGALIYWFVGRDKGTLRA